MRLRNHLFDRGFLVRNVAAAVVSIGNLTLGGTGKTPCVEYIARFFLERNKRVVILSRGYGGSRGRNDEAMLLEENLPEVPHLQGRDRVALATAALANLKGEVLVLDDGFQHRRLARDLDIVLVDATVPWGYGRLFPRGLLREAPTGLRRAGAILITRCDQIEQAKLDRLGEEIALLAPEVPVAETTHQPIELLDGTGSREGLELLRDRPVAAFCGIGNPEAFRRTLASLGVETISFREFPDHHDYPEADREELCNWASRQPRECIVLTTQKDLVKLKTLGAHSRFEGRELWALRIGLHFSSGQALFDRTLVETMPKQA